MRYKQRVKAAGARAHAQMQRPHWRRGFLHQQSAPEFVSARAQIKLKDAVGANPNANETVTVTCAREGKVQGN